MTRRLTFSAVALFLATAATPTRAADEDVPPIIAMVKEKLSAPGKPFTMFVRIPVKPGQERTIESAFAVAREHTRKEPGNITYDLIKLGGDDPVYMIHEQWKSVDALNSHIQADYIATFLAALPNLTTSEPEIVVGVNVSK